MMKKEKLQDELVRRTLEPHITAVIGAISTAIAYLIVWRFCVINDLPFFEISNQIGTSKLLILLLVCFIMLSIMFLYAFPSIKNRKDLLTRFISFKTCKDTKNTPKIAFLYNTRRFFVIYGPGISLSILVYVISAHISGTTYQPILHTLYIFEAFFLISTIISISITRDLIKRLSKKQRKLFFCSALGYNGRIFTSLTTLTILTIAIIPQTKIIEFIGEEYIFASILAITVTSLMVCCFHPSIGAKETFFFSSFMMFLTILHNPNVSDNIINNILKSLNSGYGASILIEKTIKNTPKERSTIINAKFIGENGIYFEDNKGNVQFLNRNSILKITYIKNKNE